MGPGLGRRTAHSPAAQRFEPDLMQRSHSMRSKTVVEPREQSVLRLFR